MPLSIVAQDVAEPTLIQQEIVFVLLLLIISGVAILVRKVRIPYTVALVLAGLALALLPTEGIVRLPFAAPLAGGDDEVTSELILALLVPPLIFEAALRLNLRTLRKEALPIFLLAVPGVLISTLIVGNVVSLGTQIPMTYALAFGALISATDPVAVIAFFRSLGVDKRLSVLMEGESLVNDGVAVVLFTMALTAAGSIEAGVPAASPTLLRGVMEFVRVAGGGILVGLVTGFIAAQIMGRLDERLVETTLSLAVAVGSFVIAEILGESGILAVLSAGLVIGSLDLDKMSPTTRITLYNFWELLAFVANSAVFLILGLQISIGRLVENANAVAIAVAAILISRAIVVYFMTWLSSRFSDPISMKYRHVMFWGGLRGAVSLALALSVQGPMSEDLQLMTFGVVLFTLVVQGLTIEPLIKRLGISNLARTRSQQEQLARLLMLRASRREVDALRSEGLIAQPTWKVIGDMTEEDMQAILHDHPELERTILIETRQDMLRAKRNALAEALHRGFITEDVYRSELDDLDRRILVWDRFDETTGRLAPPATIRSFPETYEQPGR